MIIKAKKKYMPFHKRPRTTRHFSFYRKRKYAGNILITDKVTVIKNQHVCTPGKATGAPHFPENVMRCRC